MPLRSNAHRGRATGLVAFLALLFACVAQVQAHDARPAYLQISEIGPQSYSVLWRTPRLSGRPLPVALELPAAAHDLTAPHRQLLDDSILERRVIELPGGLAGQRIRFPGLQGTITDVLVRVQPAGEAATTSLVRPSQPWLDVAASPDVFAVVALYFVQGVDHILLGFDHLLFVLALVLIVASLRVLFWTITAFTIAHSITLALATLGLVSVPGPPVEAAIALSIVLLACEVLRVRRGRPSLTARWPWVVAFTFGLLHGFGFAGALSDIGLPQGDIPLALFSFNVGVEAGQLLFVGAVLAVIAAARRLALPAPLTRYTHELVTLSIGSLAAFWFFERLAAFWV